MESGSDNKLLNYTVICISCIGFFLYFGVFNRHHLSYLEQNQLFRYNTDYIAGFFQNPGGLITFLDSFLTQFFCYTWVGALILTLNGFGILLLSRYIFKQIGQPGILFSLMPLMLLAALHSNHNYPLSVSLGWLHALAFYALYSRIENDTQRFVSGITFFIISYFLAGIFAFLMIALCILYEVLYRKGHLRYYLIAVILIVVLVIPYLGWRYIYLIDLRQAWFQPVVFSSLYPVRVFLFLMSLYYPVVFLVNSFMLKVLAKTEFNFSWRWPFLVPGTLLYLISIFMLVKFAYDRNNELFLKIDAHYQSSSWKKVLTLSNRYHGHNQLVLYYTNLALYNNGELADKMFQYRQYGTSGLWLEWKRNETAPFFGGEIYYQLGYTNEAYRWAFEAMEAKGLNPRSLKRLANTSIINRKYEVAEKYLHFLDQTLFYRKWAKERQRLIADTTLIFLQKELMDRRRLLITNDFIADINLNSHLLNKLLEAHPDNRMAFEYMMASFLLSKDLEAFAGNIYRLKDLGYKKIPIHYEEALVLYAGLSHKDVVPPGYSISRDTRERFHNYASIFARNRYSMDQAARALSGDFGNTFWYYMQFVAFRPGQTGADS